MQYSEFGRVIRNNQNRVGNRVFKSDLKSTVIRQLADEKLYFALILVLLDLIIVFLYVGSLLKLLVGTCQHVFVHFFYKTVILSK